MDPWTKREKCLRTLRNIGLVSVLYRSVKYMHADTNDDLSYAAMRKASNTVGSSEPDNFATFVLGMETAKEYTMP